MALEPLENRLLCALTPISDALLSGPSPEILSAPAAVAFDAIRGVLTIHGDQADNEVQQSVAADGYLELTIDGERWSARPFAENYDAALAGATSDRLRSIVMIGGGGNDRLVLGDQALYDSLYVQSDGAVVVSGAVQVDQTLYAHASSIEITGSIVAAGGFVHLLSTTTTLVQGRIDVSAPGEGVGGRVEVLGPIVALIDAAEIDARGAAGGGVVLVGGDFQGGNPAISNSQYVLVTEDSSLHADALMAGDGGKVIVWSDYNTLFYGQATARGGSLTGDGGLVEVSGKDSLTFHGTADLSAPGGALGTLLLDPANITINNGTGDGAADGNATFRGTPSNVVGRILSADSGPTIVYESELQGLSNSTNIILQATNNITMNDLADNLLALTATTGSLTIVADSDGDGVGSFSMNATDQIRTQGGAITIGGANVTAGILNTTGATNRNGGNLTIIASGTVQVTGTITTSAGAYSNNNPGKNAGAVSIAGSDVTIGAINALGRTATSNGFSGGNGGSVLITATSGLISIAGDITTTGGNGTGTGVGGNAGYITLDGPVRLSGNRTLSAVGGTGSTAGTGGPLFVESVNSDVAGWRTLTLTAGTGDVMLGGPIGATEALAALTITGNDITLAAVGGASAGVTGATSVTAANFGGDTGSIQLTGNVLTTGAQTYGGTGTTSIGGDLTTADSNITINNAAALTASAALAAGTATVTFGSTLAVSSSTLTVSANEISLAGNVTGGGGNLILRPGTTAAAMQLGGATTAANRLDLTPAKLALIQPGFSSVTFGRMDSAAAVTVNAVTLSDPTTVAAGSAALTVAGAVTSAADLSLVSGSGGIALNAAVGVGSNDLTLNSGGSVTQSASLTAAGLKLLGTAAFTLTASANDVNVVAAEIVGSVSFTDADDLSVGTVGGTTGITTGNPAAGGAVTITATGYLTIDAAIDTSSGSGGVLSAAGAVFNAATVLGAGNITLSGRNHAPVNSVPGGQSTSEDTALVFSSGNGNLVSISDLDAYSSPVRVTLTVTSGTLTLSGTSGLSFTAGDGTADATMTFAGSVVNVNSALAGITYQPTANYNGSDTLTIVTNDQGNTGSGGALSDTDTVTLTITAVNDAPVAANDGYSVNEDGVLNVGAVGILANDSDVESNPLTAILVSGPANGTLTLNADGSFDYTPDADFNGTDSFTYQASDGSANSDVATVTLTVTAVNDAPLALDDNHSVNEDGTLNVAAAGVLTNDSDIDGGAPTAVLVSGPTNGTLTLDANGAFTYTPNADFNGSDLFTYRANDGTANSNVATVTLTVNAVNDAPQAIDDGYSINENATLNVAAAGVLANDNDIDGDTLTAVLVSGPTNGTLTLNANGSFTYTSNANFSGSDSFTYRANDGAANSNVATVILTVTAVNDAPVAADDGYSVNEDAVLNIVAAGVLTNDSDIDGDALSAVLVSGPANGTLTLNADGSFTYTPSANFNGTDSFTYRANDGVANSNVATVTLTVTAVNDAPIAVDDSFSVNEDSVLNVAASGALTNDTDIDGDLLTAVIVSGPANGTITLDADGSFSYTPSANFNGTDSFTYRANDGVANSNIATVTLSITAVNDAPVAVDDGYSVNEDGVLNVAASGVLANDSDIESDPLAAVLVTGPSNGTATLNPDGSFTYTPNGDFNGTDSFTYRASDGTANSNLATVTLTVIAMNDAPVAAADVYGVNEDAALNVAAAGVLANDSDIDSDPLTAVLVSGPANGTLTLNANGSFTYAPNATFNGTDSFTYQAHDGMADSNVATVTLIVNAVNDPPLAADDSYSIVEDGVLTVLAAGVLSNDIDIEGDPLSAVLASGPTSGALTLNADGSFTYTPSVNFTGADSFTYRASDGTDNSNLATVFITVTAVNDAPFALGDAYSLNEDATLNASAAGVLANDSDIDGDPLTAVLVSGPANGTLTLDADGSFNYTPNANFNGTDAFAYKANDGTADSNVVTVTLTMNAVNDAPSAAADAYSVDEDLILTVAVAGVLSNDTDIEVDPLSAALVTGPANGTLTVNADGSFSYTPNTNFNGTDSFTYKANDGAADSNVVAVTLTINAVNDAPSATADAYSVDEDDVLTVAAAGVLANDGDIDGNSLSAVLVTGPASGTLTLNSDGSFTYTPTVNFHGIDSFTYKANDGTTDGNVVTATLNVNAMNDAPSATADAYSVNEDNVLTVAAAGVLANDSDIDSDPLSGVLVTGPANGTLTLNADGSFTYAPNANFNGTDSFTYNANDGAADSNVVTVTLTVNAVNDSPSATADSCSVDEDGVLTVIAPGVLSNDTDIEGDPLSAVLVTGPASGTLTLNTDGSFAYTPNANFNGTDSFTYNANDGTDDGNVATVTLTVNGMNDAPSATADAYTVNEDNVLTVAAAGVLANDSDIDGDPLSAVLVTGPANGTLTLNADGSFSYTANANFNGADSFTYQANDGTADSDVVTVALTVTATNDAPTVADDTYGVPKNGALIVSGAGVLLNDSDIDGDPLSAVIVSGPANGTLTLNAAGSFTYTPNIGFYGTDSFTYQATDGLAGSNVATVTISVNRVDVIAVGSDSGPQGSSHPSVRVYDAETSALKFVISASATYGVNHRGGVRVAVADIDGDGFPDIITAPGPGARPVVKIFRGNPDPALRGTLLATIAAPRTFGTSYLGGVNVAAGDIDGDGAADIVIGRDVGKGMVKVFRNTILESSSGPLLTQYRSFNAFPELNNYHGGARLTVGNTFGGPASSSELLVATGVGVAGKIRVFSLSGSSPVRLRTIQDPTGFAGGLYVAAGDIDGDGLDDIVTSRGPKGNGQIGIYDNAGNPRGTFRPFQPSENQNATVHITLRDGDGDGRSEIFAVQGADGRSGYKVKHFDALTAELVDSFFATGGNYGGGGLNIG